MTREDLENAVYDWVARSLPGRHVRFEDQDLPPPRREYATIKLVEIDYLPNDVSTYSDDGAQQTMRGLCKVEFRVGAIDGDAMSDAQRLMYSLNADLAPVEFQAKIGLSDVGPLQDLTQDVEGRLMRRGEFRFSGYATLSHTFDASCISTATANVEGSP